MMQIRDEFLSDEDLDLKSLSDEELDRVWTEWLVQAQITNDLDRSEYSHGVFAREPAIDAGSQFSPMGSPSGKKKPAPVTRL
ncbi:MAG: hypothetical protein HYU64_16005 [Armatimonadetes bacterium]|nr:hypothetical protein [Armatimonadota bacterium]